MDSRDKSKTYTTDYDKFSIATFWFEGTKELKEGWLHKIIDK